MLGHLALMRRIGVGMEQDDRQCFDALASQLIDGTIHCRQIQRHQHIALEVHPLAHLADAPARNETRRAGIEDVHHLVTLPLARHFVNVAKAFGHEQAGNRALFFEDRVKRMGRAMEQIRHRLSAPLGTQFFKDMIEDFDLPLRIGRNLFNLPDLTARFIENGDIGKSPADVDTYT